jgi:hypothetical protein
MGKAHPLIRQPEQAYHDGSLTCIIASFTNPMLPLSLSFIGERA